MNTLSFLYFDHMFVFHNARDFRSDGREVRFTDRNGVPFTFSASHVKALVVGPCLDIIRYPSEQSS